MNSKAELIDFTIRYEDAAVASEPLPEPPPSLLDALSAEEQADLFAFMERIRFQAGGRLDGPRWHPAPARPDADPVEQGPAGYLFQRVIGRGGMGSVYQAHEVRLNRTVAVKMLSAGRFATADSRARFGREAELVARLQHPGIVQIFSVGTHDGCPYLALEYVPGGTLSGAIHAQQPHPREAAQFVVLLAEAVAYAHAMGVVHRDLKPANVLLSPLETVPSLSGQSTSEPAPRLNKYAPKITDFGLAKCVTDELDATQSGTILGTPAYMAPEQAAGRRDIGPPADVYALCAILYECLTGRRPFDGSKEEILDHLQSRLPNPPRRAVPAIPPDLETITLHGLKKEPDRRYPSAAALAEDLQRFLDGEPLVHARWVGRAERVRLFCRRRPTLAGLTAVAAVLTLTAGILAIRTWDLSHAVTQAEADLVGAGEQITRQEHTIAQQGSQVAAAERTAAAATVESQEKGRQELLRRYCNDMLTARRIWHQGSPAALRDMLVRYVPVETGRPDVRGWEWHYWWHLCNRPPLWKTAGRVPAPDGRVVVAFSPDGRFLAVANEDASVQLLDTSTGAVTQRLVGTGGPLLCMKFSPDGGSLVAGGASGVVRVWDVRTAAERRNLTGHTSAVTAVAIADSGRHVASYAADLGKIPSDGEFRVWDGSSGKVLTSTANVGPVTSLEFSPDGKRVVTSTVSRGPGDPPAATTVHDIARNEIVATVPGDGTAATFLPDGRTVAVADRTGTVGLWIAGESKPFGRLLGGESITRQLSPATDGRRIIGVGTGRQVTVWDAADRRVVGTYRGFDGTPFAACFAGNALRLVTCQPDSGLAVWEWNTDEEGTTFSETGWPVRGLSWDPGGHRVVTLAWDGVVSQHELGTGLTSHPGGTARPSGEGTALALSADGSKAAVLQRVLGLNIVEVRTRVIATGSDLPNRDPEVDRLVSESLGTYGLGRPPWPWEFLPGGKGLLGVTPTGLALYDESTNALRLLPGGPRRRHDAVGFGAGRIAAIEYDESLTHDSSYTLWSAAGDAVRSTKHPMPPDVIELLAGSPDGTRVVGRTRDNALVVWDHATAKVHKTLYADPQPITAAAFSPDGSRLVSVAQFDGRQPDEPYRAKVWELESGTEVLELSGQTAARVYAVRFSPDGRAISIAAGELARDYATAPGRIETRVWTTTTPTPAKQEEPTAASQRQRKPMTVVTSPRKQEAVTRLSGHSGVILALAFDGDGRRVAVVNHDGEACCWHLSGKRPPVFVAKVGVAGNTAAVFENDTAVLSVVSSGGPLMRYQLARANMESGQLLGEPVLYPERTTVHLSRTRLLVSTATRTPSGRRGEDVHTVREHGSERTVAERRGGTALGLSPDGRWAAVLKGERGSVKADKTVELWATAPGGEVVTFDGPEDKTLSVPTDVCVGSEGTFVAALSRGYDGNMIWERPGGKRPLRKLDWIDPADFDNSVVLLAISSDGRRQVTYSQMFGSLIVCDTRTGKGQASLKVGELDTNRPLRAAFSHDGTKVAIPVKHSMWVWDIPTKTGGR